jgi:Right handed beta helix region
MFIPSLVSAVLGLSAASPAGGLAPAVCLTTVTGASLFTCRVDALAPATQFELQGAPEGMAVQPRSGFLHWTPDPEQIGTTLVTIRRTAGSVTRSDPQSFLVPAALPVPAGIYVSPQGRDNGAGTLADPYQTLQRAADRVQPGGTIYLRGGRYFNQGYGTDFANRPRDNFARITTSGTANAWITLRPYGNEYVTLVSDVNGIVFKDANYWRVQGLELEGTARQLGTADSLALWWNTTDLVNKISGRGIALNSSSNFELSNLVVHDFNGAGISNNGGAYITLSDSVIYNNGWWTTAGTHGFANSKPVSDRGNTGAFKITMQRNLLFGNQSSMISHVFDKGLVKLEIDEGNGLHMQNTEEDFFGRFLVEHNLSVLNGKAGLGLNTVDHGVIRNNSFYANAQAVDNAAELTLQDSSADSIAMNLFHALPQRRTIKDSQDSFVGVGSNYAVPSFGSGELPASVLQVAAVFANPSGGDFHAAPGIPPGYGAAPAALAMFAARAAEFGVAPAAAPTVIDENYHLGLRAQIFATWPAPVPGDGIPDDLILEDPRSGFCYRYQDRNDYPGPPSSGTNCPANAKRQGFAVAPVTPAAADHSETAALSPVAADASTAAAPAVAAVATPAVAAVSTSSAAVTATTLSQMADNTPGSSGASCGRQGSSTSATRWWRRFYFNEHAGVGASAVVQSVTVSTGTAAPAGLALTVNLYRLPHAQPVDTIDRTALELLGSGSASVNGPLATLTVPVAASIADTAADDLVVELRSDGNASGGQFYPGANTTAETHPTFISSEACGVFEPRPAAELGFADFHLTLQVNLGDDRIFANGFEP